MVFGRPHAIDTYCRDETDPIALSAIFHFVADHDIGDMENGCSGTDGLWLLPASTCGLHAAPDRFQEGRVLSCENPAL